MEHRPQIPAKTSRATKNPCECWFPPLLLLREFGIFVSIANSRNIILHSRNIARSRNCSYSRIVLNRGPTLTDTFEVKTNAPLKLATYILSTLSTQHLSSPHGSKQPLPSGIVCRYPLNTRSLLPFCKSKETW